MQILRYDPSLKEQWDSFVTTSKNGTFLFLRDYMDYHSDRFTDCSFIFLHKGRWIALLPGTIRENVYYSHAGLTYGGVIMDKKIVAKQVLELFDLACCTLRNEYFLDAWIYRTIPYIYHTYPADEDLYALFRCGAVLCERKISTVIPFHQPLPFSSSRRRDIRTAQKQGLVLCRDDDYAAFWEILIGNLQKWHRTLPVHGLGEILHLHRLFPENLLLYRVEDASGETVGGTLLYHTGRVMHVQYIGSSDRGKQLGANNFLFASLIDKQYWEKQSIGFDYFDFGISTEQGGKYLNDGLIFQKESFGGRAVMYDSYKLDLRCM